MAPPTLRMVQMPVQPMAVQVNDLKYGAALRITDEKCHAAQ